MTAPLSTAGMAGPEATASEQSRMELQARLNGLGGLNGRKLSPEAKAQKLREACEGFESIFIQKMWQEMRNAVPKTGLLAGREERFWQDMYDQELSKSMTRAGGIGLADMMYEQLSSNLVSASRGAASSVMGAAFTPSAAPMLVQGQDDGHFEPAPAAGSIYDGEAPAAGAAVADAQPAEQVTAAAAPTGQALAQVQSQPVQMRYSAAANTEHDRSQHRAADLNQASGLLMARQARRDAGDKLGARAVRPARNSRQRERRQEVHEPAAQQTAQAAAGAISQNGLVPGSPEALKAAMAQARAGYQEQEPVQAAINLHNLVANVQARNAMPQAAQQVADAEPVIRRVRKSTNIPQNNRKKIKNGGQAIRTLNVDNVGVNSRQGQGLAAYHAQQDAAARQSQPLAAAQPDQATQPLTGAVPPLTAASRQNESGDSGFTIPPLTASGRS